MAVSLTLRPEQIARAECILADGLESIQAVKKRTGADILFNWPIYDFDGGTIRSRFCLFGSRFGDYPSWGIAFGADGKPFWDYDGESGAPCFAGAYSYLVRDGKIADSLADKSTNGRTAMGLKADGSLVIYVVAKNSAQACSTAALGRRMRELGCVQAINGDGSYSSQIITPAGQIVTGRKVAGYIGIWLVTEPGKPTKPDEEEPMKSIYLSPSTQENNVGAGSYGTEEQRMNEIMDLIENQLRGRYILYRNRPNMTLQQVVADSNAKNPDLHFALHSNAGGGSGAECWICAKGGQAERFANRLYEELSALTPGKDRGVKVSTSLYEVNRTKAPAVILEVEFHDTPEGAAWILANKEAIARACVRAIMGHFGDKVPDSIPGTPGNGGASEPEQPGTDKWYEKELAEAVAAGITDGTRPDDPCTRAEAAVMVLRATKGE